MSTADSSVHYIQSQAWGDIKRQYGWKVEHLDCSYIPSGFMQAYSRLVIGVGRLIYVPCVYGVTPANSKHITDYFKQTSSRKGFAVRLELNQLYDEKLVSELMKQGWKQAKNHVQYRHTIIVDLTQPEDNIWMGLKSRGRYEVLQAQKAGVMVTLVEPSDENLHKMYDLMQITSNRNKFFIRDKKFTLAYWRKFRETGQLRLFFAMHEGELLAGSVILTNGKLAWNKDGGSTRTKANLMAPRLIQWEAMKALKREGFISYDLGGIPDPAGFNNSSIPGIYIFKSGFSKEYHTLMPTMELPLSVRYKLWRKAEPNWLRVYNLFAHNLWW